MTKCESDCVISFATIFSQEDTEIESGAYIGQQCNIGMCRIERNCLIGSGVHILSGKRQHNFDDIEKPIRNQGGSFEKVVIGEDTWIGNKALILANVGKKCVIAAGSVVINDVPDYSVMAGNPARLVKSRCTEIDS
jgi:acetyltransferase-like isoleucine patch superfamily enzyme